jgi:hypothetical protein
VPSGPSAHLRDPSTDVHSLGCDSALRVRLRVGRNFSLVQTWRAVCESRMEHDSSSKPLNHFLACSGSRASRGLTVAMRFFIARRLFLQGTLQHKKEQYVECRPSPRCELQ